MPHTHTHMHTHTHYAQATPVFQEKLHEHSEFFELTLHTCCVSAPWSYISLCSNSSFKANKDSRGILKTNEIKLVTSILLFHGITWHFHLHLNQKTVKQSKNSELRYLLSANISSHVSNLPTLNTLEVEMHSFCCL